MSEASIQSLGASVRERPRANRMSQHALTELAGVSQPFISELEREKPTVRLDAVNRVLAVFGKQVGVVEAPRPEVHP